MSAPHPFSNDCWMHPCNLIFIALKALNAGFQLPEKMSSSACVAEFYNVHMIAFVYYVLTDFFLNDGQLSVIGAASLRQIELNKSSRARYIMLRKIVSAEYDAFFRCAEKKKFNSILCEYLRFCSIIPSDMTASDMNPNSPAADGEEEEDDEALCLPTIGKLFNFLILLYDINFSVLS